MAAVLDRSGAPPPTDLTETEVIEYDCACAGFKTLNIMLMCLRCLDAYSEGLPHVLNGDRLQFEMERVAKRLAVLLKGDPLIANLPAQVVLRAGS